MQPNTPPVPTPPPSPVPPHPPEYGFILDPEKPNRGRLPVLPSNSPPVVKIAVVLGGVLVLIILFVIIRGLLSGGGNTEALLAVAQDQQEIIHLVTAPPQQTNSQTATLSATNQNFAITAQTTLTSAQTQLITYLKNNGHKIGVKQLNQKISATTDEQLKTAAANSTYDTTFQQVMQTKLKDYQTALQQAYKVTSGPKGRHLLDQQYQGSELLLKQLNAPQT